MHFEDLCSAIESGNIEYIEQILSSQPELVNQANKNGDTPVHIAARNAKAETLNAILNCLNDNQKVEVLTKANNDGDTPVYIAAQHYYAETLNAILNCLNDNQKVEVLNKTNKYGDTPVYIAARNAKVETLNAILDCFNDNQKKSELLNKIFGDQEVTSYSDQINALINNNKISKNKTDHILEKQQNLEITNLKNALESNNIEDAKKAIKILYKEQIIGKYGSIFHCSYFDFEDGDSLGDVAQIIHDASQAQDCAKEGIYAALNNSQFIQYKTNLIDANNKQNFFYGVSHNSIVPKTKLDKANECFDWVVAFLTCDTYHQYLDLCKNQNLTQSTNIDSNVSVESHNKSTELKK